jgi:long-subunit fatty acid transport protein
MQNEEVIAFTESDNYLNTGALKRVDVGDVYLDFGFMYKLKLDKQWNMNLGLVFVPTQALRTKQSEFNFTYSGDPGRSRVIDTVSFEENASNSIILPPKLGLGVLLSRSDRFTVGLDIEYIKWSVSNYNTITGLSDAITLRTGLEYTGKDNRYKLRMGLRYGQLPITLTNRTDNSEIKLDEVAVSFGVALPIRSKDKLTLTEMNFGAEIGKRGKNITGALLEQYINVHIGLTLNNKWFIKRKYD